MANTLGRAGAEVALAELLRRLVKRDDADIDLFVLTGIGELGSEVPPEVHIVGHYEDGISPLSAVGRKALTGLVLTRAKKGGTGLRLFPYIFRNFCRELAARQVLADKLLWRLLSDGAPVPKQTYDLAVAFHEGGASYYVADHVNAEAKAAFVHVDYHRSGYTPDLDHGIYAAFDRIFPVSGEVKDAFLDFYPEAVDRTFVFENLIDADRVRALAEEPGFDDGYEGIRLLSVGRLVYLKGFDVAIRSMKLVKEHYGGKKPVRWYILGEGELKKQLTEAIVRLSLEEDVVLLGTRENPYPFMKQCDIYIQPSRYEGKSMAIREAQILGCPLILSDCPGNREQICSGEEGLLVPLDEKAFAGAIVALIDDPQRRARFGERNAGKPGNGREWISLLTDLYTGAETL